METKEAKTNVEVIRFSEKVAYGSGDLASCLIQALTTSYLTFFYTDAVGLNAAIIGIIMMCSRFMDGFTDILMGYVVDRTHSKYGKARPWLLWLAIPMSIATILVFLVPNIGETGKYIFVIITYNLVSTFLYTMINIPYGTLTSLMTRDQEQRLSINVVRNFMAQVGTLIVNALVLPMVNVIGGSTQQRNWVIVAVIYSVAAAILFYVCFFKTKERVVIDTVKKQNVKFGTALKLTLRNDQWILVSMIWLAYALSTAMAVVMSTYYCKYILLNENITGIVTAASSIPVLLVMPFSAQLGQKMGKRNLGLLGGVIFLVGQLMMFLNPASSGWIIACSAITGIGKTGILATVFAMVADTIEYGEWKNGTRVEGTLYSSSTFGAKIGAGIAGAVVMSMLGSAGYDGLAATQTAAAMSCIRNVFLLGPVIFIVIMIFLYFIYKLDKVYPTVMHDLKEREAKK